MPVKGIERVRKNLKLALGKIDNEKTEAALIAVLNEGLAVSLTMVPIDTSFLINSQYKALIAAATLGRMSGTVGFTASYAQAVHDASGKLKGRPRADFGSTRAGNSFGGGTGQGTYWSPNAEPGFLSKGFDEIIPIIPNILKAVYGV